MATIGTAGLATSATTDTGFALGQAFFDSDGTKQSFYIAPQTALTITADYKLDAALDHLGDCAAGCNYAQAYALMSAEGAAGYQSQSAEVEMYGALGPLTAAQAGTFTLIASNPTDSTVQEYFTVASASEAVAVFEVPEPSDHVLMLCGLASLAAVSKRRRPQLP